MTKISVHVHISTFDNSFYLLTFLKCGALYIDAYLDDKINISQFRLEFIKFYCLFCIIFKDPVTEKNINSFKLNPWLKPRDNFIPVGQLRICHLVGDFL